MNNPIYPIEEFNYRASYGKLFSALINQFGVNHVSEIEDAIQNTFLKSLKKWKAEQIPKNRDNWLFIVARNDLINQLKKKKALSNELDFIQKEVTAAPKTDLRLEVILLVSSSKKISTQAKITFILKNIFGLHIREISESTLLNHEAVYKSINRAKKSLRLEFKNSSHELTRKEVGQDEISVVEEILYAVFNIGFDSFNEKIKSIVNEDLCLEALSLIKLLSIQYRQNSTKNLLALFCFHIARIPAKVSDGKLIPFFNQDRKKWNKELVNLGFHYLSQPKKPSKFYIESLIISKYMLADAYTIVHWNDIIKLYELLMQHSNSPIIGLNYCFCLHKAERTEEALGLLRKLETQLPNEHVYFSLVKAKLLKASKPKESEDILSSVLNKMSHSIRKEYLLENGFINL